MKIKIISTKFHPFLKDREDYIYDIKYSQYKGTIIILMKESKKDYSDDYGDIIYRVYTYVYPSLGDQFKVIKY
tara:strand:- start:111 stop:329 length:219 start_codon:yes stop_codon:yes gene_type:complete